MSIQKGSAAFSRSVGFERENRDVVVGERKSSAPRNECDSVRIERLLARELRSAVEVDV